MKSLSWRELLEKLEITSDESNTEILSREELSSTETETGILLPANYKELCQTLGTGLLAERVRIICPTKRYVENERLRLNYAIGRIQEYTRTDISRAINRDREFISLLESAFVFGDLYHSYYSLVWDLRTYSKNDDSYDIYYVNCDTPESSEPILLGRNFFEFIDNFCYGTKPFELLSEMFEEEPSNEIKYTFFQFSTISVDS